MPRSEDPGRPPRRAIARSATPRLSPEHAARLRTYGSPEPLTAGRRLFGPGDAAYDLFLVDAGEVHVIAPAVADAPEEPIVGFGPDEIVGELSLLSGEAPVLIGRVARSGCAHRVSAQGLRRLMDEDPELCDLLLRVFVARRARLSAGAARHTTTIVGPPRVVAETFPDAARAFGDVGVAGALVVPGHPLRSPRTVATEVPPALAGRSRLVIEAHRFASEEHEGPRNLGTNATSLAGLPTLQPDLRFLDALGVEGLNTIPSAQ